jgi:hypothetical protein
LVEVTPESVATLRTGGHDIAGYCVQDREVDFSDAISDLLQAAEFEGVHAESLCRRALEGQRQEKKEAEEEALNRLPPRRHPPLALTCLRARRLRQGYVKHVR